MQVIAQIASANIGTNVVADTKCIQFCLGSNFALLVINSTAAVIPSAIDQGYVQLPFKYV